jgi:hypothetical protein
LVAVTAGHPRVLVTDDGRALPSGPFAVDHRSLQSGLRNWVEERTHHPLGYVEQLYTFADRDRARDEFGRRVISISYLALTQEARPADGALWQEWYTYFPWEDHRGGAPPLLTNAMLPRLRAWADRAGESASTRRQRLAIAFGVDGELWNEDFILQRYEMLFEADMLPESLSVNPIAGKPMDHDHRRILATGIARLRAKIKYRPVVFELMPLMFTLFQLQRCVEAIAGRRLHKPNFRRLIEQQALLEETEFSESGTSGRPAKLFRFRRGVLAERAVSGSKLPLARI